MVKEDREGTRTHRLNGEGIGSLERYVARAIEAAATPFQRLAFVGSLRDSYTGQYLHEGWAGIASAEEVHAVLDDIHRRVFGTVLRLPITDLSKELRHHFALLKQPEQRTSLLWLETEPFRDLIPRGCSVALRQLFVSQVRIALEVVCRAPDWAAIAGPAVPPSAPCDKADPWLN